MKKIALFFYFFGVLLFSVNAQDDLPLRGRGDYKWLFLHIYEARLWAHPGDDLFERPLALELKYSRSFKGKDIVTQSVKELKNAGISDEQLKQWTPKLLEIFPDVEEGDTIKASFNPKEGIVFFLNKDKELGKLVDLNFSKKFLEIWLGEKTSAPDLRNKLLGKNI